jgi:hypothetical protein
MRRPTVTGSKHRKGTTKREKGLMEDTPRPPDDLARNPGIGGSKGTFARSGADPEDLAADNTVKGDVMNDTNAQGGVDPDQTGRTNR